MGCCKQYIGDFCKKDIEGVVQGFITMNNGIPSYEYFEFDSGIPYYGEVDINCSGGENASQMLNENYVKALRSNQESDFSNASAFLVVGNQLYIGTKATGVNTNFIIHYPNLLDLSTFTKIPVPATGGVRIGGIESMCYDETNNMIYAVIYGTRFIMFINPSNISSYTTYEIDLQASVTFNGVVLADDLGVNIYTSHIVGSGGRYNKILISTKAITATVTTPAIYGAEIGAIDLSTRELYYVSLSIASQLIIINIATFTLSNNSLNIDFASEGLVYIPSFSVTFQNLLAVSSIKRNNLALNNNKFGAVAVDIPSVGIEKMDLLPSTYLYYDVFNDTIYSVGDGYVETINLTAYWNLIAGNLDFTMLELVKTYIYRGKKLNRIAVIDGKVYATIEGQSTGGSLKEIELIFVPNSVITRTEAKYRFSNYYDA